MSILDAVSLVDNGATRLESSPPSSAAEKAMRRLDLAVEILDQCDDPDVRLVAAALVTWQHEGGPELTFDAALGLPWGWRTTARLAQRDAVLRGFGRRHWPALRGRALACAIADRAHQYETRSFERHRAIGRPDGIEGDLFDLLTLSAMPGLDRLRQILSNPAG